MNTFTLKNFQKQFVSMLTSNIESLELVNDIIPAGNLESAHEAIGAHKNGYIARLTEALGETFEGTWFSMGDELFFEICEQYIKRHHSIEYNLSNYGLNFPLFLEEKKDYINIPFIQDMARFDWLFKEIYHEEQHSHILTSDLLRLQENLHLRLLFGNAVRLYDSQYAIYQIWKERKGSQDNVIHHDFERPEFIILYKNDNNIFARNVPKIQFEILVKLQNGVSLNSILEETIIENQDDFLKVFQIIGSTNIISNLF